MNKSNSFSKDLLMVVLSNTVVLLSSILTGFVVPKMLGVTEYGYFKLFSLYLGYSSILHFGFVDGILLKYAGTSYKDLDKKLFRSYTRFYLISQIVISVIIIIISLITLSVKIRYIFVLLGIDVIFVNLTAYYQYISQATIRFKELSIRKVLLAVFKVVLVLGLLIVPYYFKNVTITALIYTGGLVFIDLLLTVWYAFTYKDISFGNTYRFGVLKDKLIPIYKNGFIITISFQAAHLIFSLDRQFVSVLFDASTYGVYAFAYNLISLVTTIIGATSLVLFPHLKTMVKEDIIVSYGKAVSSLFIVSFASLLLYQPLRYFIGWYLPDYIESLQYLKIIFPGLVLSSCISIIMFSYFRALDAHIQYFKICCMVLAISFILNLLVIKIFNTPESVSMASIGTLFLWFYLCQAYFVKKYNIEWVKNTLYALLLIFGFYSINYFINSNPLSFISYLSMFITLTFAFYKDICFELISRFGKLLKK